MHEFDFLFEYPQGESAAWTDSSLYLTLASPRYGRDWRMGVELQQGRVTGPASSVGISDTGAAASSLALPAAASLAEDSEGSGC